MSRPSPAFALPSPPSFLHPSISHVLTSTRHPMRRRLRAKRPRPGMQFSQKHPPSTSAGIRPDLVSPYPTFLPQTIEHSLLRAQSCTASFLQAEDHSPTPLLLRVELPMGRSRRFWYRMSPAAMAVNESSTLVLHFSQLFCGLRLSIVMAEGADSAQPVAWGETLSLSDAAKGEGDVRTAEVIVLAGAGEKRRKEVEALLELCGEARAVVLFNCFMDAPLGSGVARAADVYVCRALEKCAVLREGAGAPWAVFVEIAVFEYEWVGDRWEREGEDGERWIPVQKNVEAYAMSRSATRKAGHGYWKTSFAGCEAGFWPFMTIAAEQILPIDGKAMEEDEKAKTEKKAKKSTKRPFGFF